MTGKKNIIKSNSDSNQKKIYNHYICSVLINKKPEWLKKKIDLNNLKEMSKILNFFDLNTVCQSAKCPNINECFLKNTATFMILGNVCTRNCSFCAISKGKPKLPNINEPINIAKAAHKLNLKHIVITSVTRDDLEDGGAEQFANCIYEIKKLLPNSTIEILIPDFKINNCINKKALDKIIKANPNIINHNLETVPSLYPIVRPIADYMLSLEVLKYIKEKNNSIITKSGIMLGIGETKEEVISLINDLVAIKCDMLTIGQYLPPSNNHLKLKEYILPEKFIELKEIALRCGIKYVASGSYIRSSYNAMESMEDIKLSKI
jgi:lipoic acid synthetase